MKIQWKPLLGLAIVATLVWFFFFHVVASAQEEAVKGRVSVNVPRHDFHNPRPAISLAEPFLRLGDHWTVISLDQSVAYDDYGELVLNLQRELESRLSDPSPAQYARIDVIVWKSDPLVYVGRVPLEVFRP